MLSNKNQVNHLSNTFCESSHRRPNQLAVNYSYLFVLMFWPKVIH